MNKGISKHYSLLFQDDTDFSEDILSIHNEKISDEDEEDDDDDGFKSMIGEDIEERDDMDDIDESEDIEEVDCSDEEIFNNHRSLSNDGLRLAASKTYGRKEYQLLTNGEIDQKSSVFEAPLSTVWIPTPMSPVRRAFFLASIMFGILVVAMFLWALPCNVQPCQSNLSVGPNQWFTEIDNVGINYTKLVSKIDGDLSLFLSYYDVIKFKDNETSKADLTPKSCGLLRLNENLGKEQWRYDIQECPHIINCELMDSTGDGILDCLILGHKSLIIMVEPIYGSIFWHVHHHIKDNTSLPLDELRFDMPILLQDLDSDGFMELLFPTKCASSSFLEIPETSHLILVSGRTGAIMGKPYAIANCHEILNIYEDDVSIGYSCSMENRSELMGKIPLTTLLNEISKSFDQYNFTENLQFKNVIDSPEANEAVCQIKYTNKGKCPYCKTRIEMGLTSENPVYKDFEYASVVSWNVLSYGNTCRGAILKLWKWDSSSLQKAFIESKPSVKASSSTIQPSKSGIELNGPIGSGSQVDDSYLYNPSPKRPFFTKTRRQVNIVRKKRTLSSNYNFFVQPVAGNGDDAQALDNKGTLSTAKSLTDDSTDRDATLPPSLISPPANYRLQNLEEVLVLVMFNGSDWVSRELGSMIVYQLCKSHCIPSHMSQANTVLIDQDSVDGNQWNIFVSSSTFSSVREESKNKSGSWSLESYVRKLIVDVEQDQDIL